MTQNDNGPHAGLPVQDTTDRGRAQRCSAYRMLVFQVRRHGGNNRSPASGVYCWSGDAAWRRVVDNYRRQAAGAVFYRGGQA